MHPDGDFVHFKVEQKFTAGPYDIALLELGEQDQIDLTIHTPVCMAKHTDGNSFDNKIATAAGWGFLQEEPEIIRTDVPNHVKMRVKPQSECTYYKSTMPEHPADLCTWWEEGGRNTCKVRVIITIDSLSS